MASFPGLADRPKIQSRFLGDNSLNLGITKGIANRLDKRANDRRKTTAEAEAEAAAKKAKDAKDKRKAARDAKKAEANKTQGNGGPTQQLPAQGPSAGGPSGDAGPAGAAGAGVPAKPKPGAPGAAAMPEPDNDAVAQGQATIHNLVAHEIDMNGVTLPHQEREVLVQGHQFGKLAGGPPGEMKTAPKRLLSPPVIPSQAGSDIRKKNADTVDKVRAGKASTFGIPWTGRTTIPHPDLPEGRVPADGVYKIPAPAGTRSMADTMADHNVGRRGVFDEIENFANRQHTFT